MSTISTSDADALREAALATIADKEKEGKSAMDEGSNFPPCAKILKQCAFPMIQFKQLNLNARISATLELDVKTPCNTIFLLQEPHISTTGKPSVANKNTFFFKQGLSVLEAHTAIYIPSSTDFTFMPLHEFISADLTAGIVESNWWKKPLVIGSIYMAGDRSLTMPEWELLIEFTKNKNLPLLCAADTNSHSHLWGCKKDSVRGRELECFLGQHNFLRGGRSHIWWTEDCETARNNFKITEKRGF
jgi:hypothetical protein